MSSLHIAGPPSDASAGFGWRAIAIVLLAALSAALASEIPFAWTVIEWFDHLQLGIAAGATGSSFVSASRVADVLLFCSACVPALALARRRRTPRTASILAFIAAALAVPLVSGIALALVGIATNLGFALVAGVAGICYALAWHYAVAAELRRRRRYEKLAWNESNRLKTEFLNHLTHELRTPLTAIMGFNKINQLTDELGKEQRIANSAVIARNCEHLLALINNNLDLAKIEAGQLAITRTPEDPEQVFGDVLATLRALATDKPLELKYTRLTPLPEALMLDVSRLRQVLLNLIGNAVKFTERGSVELAVTWHIAALEIEVRDTGTGIELRALERIWEPFKQADLTIGRRFGGTGLGLAISRKLVQLMGGEISVESQLGVGTIFKVRIPSEAVAKRELPESAGSSLTPPVAVRERLYGRVLLADDNEDARSLVALLLRNIGVQVQTVENGLEATETAMRERPDVILMDMEMPVMNGFEAVHVLRTRGYAGAILGLTAHQEAAEVARAILSGCDSVLTKPIAVDALKEALTPVLEHKREQFRSAETTPVSSRVQTEPHV